MNEVSPVFRSKAEVSFVVGLGLAILFGCTITDPSDVIDVEVVVSDSIVTAVAPVVVEVTATNRSVSDISVSSSGCPQLFHVLNASGEVVGPEGVACALIAMPPAILRPGESIAFRYNWSGGANSEIGARVPDGEYQVQGWVLLMSHGPVYSESVPVRATGTASSPH